MQKPNIILISIDTLRADHLSCYGYKRLTTPNLDHLAEEGVLFTNAYSTAVWTPPAHASMLTGLYPKDHGVVHQNSLRNEVPTIATLLRNHGYQTAGFANNSQVGELVGLNQGFDDFYEVWRGLSKKQILKRLIYHSKRIGGYIDDGASLTNKLVFNWLDKRWNEDKPFYLFIHYIEAHNPLKAPKPFKYKFLTKDIREQVDMAKIWKVANNPLICLTDELKLNETEIEALHCLYDEEINYVDSKIGELTDFLVQKKLINKTILIITADHGEHFGEHGFYSHIASLYEPVVHIPFILRYPSEISSHSRSHQLVQHIDLMPTILEVVGVYEEGKLSLTGRNLLDCLNGEEDSRILFAEWEGRIPYFIRDRLKNVKDHPLIERLKKPLWMARSGNFKLIADDQGHYQLYNLKRDPDEKNNLCRQDSTLFQHLKQALDDWLKEKADAGPSQTYDYEDEILKKHLKELGYL